MSESEELVRVLAAKHHFAVLRLPVPAEHVPGALYHAGVEEWVYPRSVIRDAYKPIALVLHPDKCKDARASTAFRLLTEAEACLADLHKQVEHLRASVHGHTRGRGRGHKRAREEDFDDGTYDGQAKRSWADREREYAEDKQETEAEAAARRAEASARREEQRAETARHEAAMRAEVEARVMEDVEANSNSWKKWRKTGFRSYRPPVPRTTAMGARPVESVCDLCKRSFPSQESLWNHERLSQMHRANVDKLWEEELPAGEAGVPQPTAPTAEAEHNSEPPAATDELPSVSEAERAVQEDAWRRWQESEAAFERAASGASSSTGEWAWATGRARQDAAEAGRWTRGNVT